MEFVVDTMSPKSITAEVPMTTPDGQAKMGSMPLYEGQQPSAESILSEHRRMKYQRHQEHQRKRELKEERRRKRDLKKRSVNECHRDARVIPETFSGAGDYTLSSSWEVNFSDQLYSMLPPSIFPSPTALDEKSVSLPLAADVDRAAPSHTVVDFTKHMKNKKDHPLRPLIVCPTGRIYLENTSALCKPATDFLVSVAEPISRPETIQEFQITVFSLYAAIGMGMSVDCIIQNLNKFSKNEIPESLTNLLRSHGEAFGRVKLVLRDNRYFLESHNREDLEYLLLHPVISEARIRNSMVTRQIHPSSVNIPSTPGGHVQTTTRVEEPNDKESQLESGEAPVLDPSILGFKLTGCETASDRNAQTSNTEAYSETAAPLKQVFLFEIKSNYAGKVKECALNDIRRPLLTEYDFRRDQKNATLNVALKTTTKIRYYQERSLRKMFSNGRARSGIIVLPCGAGKTLTGITAATTIRKSCMVLTSSSVAVDQWKRAFQEFTTIDSSLVITLTSERKQNLSEGAVVLISTYTMMAYSGKRSVAAAQIINQVREREWGLLIFDEVQFAPAPAFRKINDIVKSHCKLGLTATLVREDDLIHDLQWIIGPKLYESNWLELQESGYLAKVQVSEVWCTMTADFYREYLRAPHAKQRKLWVCNPNKLRVCEYLLRFHEARNDKIIVFSDNLFALKEVACALKKPFISGQVGMQERMIILNKFKTSPKLNTIFLSKVGDNAIDIPCANVVVQISFNFASRRQEAQRLGRILRPKNKSSETFNAFFYSLVSKDTQEMLYADKRQQFIIDQGYSYKVLPISAFPMDQETLLYDDPQRQRDMLARIMSSNDQCMDIEIDDDVVLNDSQEDISALESITSPTNDKINSIETMLSRISNADVSSFATHCLVK